MKVLKILKSAGLVATTFFCSACAGTYKQNLDFNPAEPIRVAVLPFVSVDEKGEIIKQEGRLILDNITVVSKKQEETPPQIVRRATLSELEKTNLDLVMPALIDLDLPHHGFLNAENQLDMKAIYNVSPTEMCSQFLNCDAVLYGKVTRWDRSYYGLQTNNTVGIELKLVSARDGKVLYTAQGEDSDSRGLSKGPTGWSSLVIEPIKGLDSEIIVDLSRKVVQKMIDPLNAKKRPVFLESAPPAIVSVSHDAPDGRISRGEPLVVVMMGSDGQQASFSIGDKVEKIPMVERSAGHYYGEYIPLAGDAFEAQPVTTYLTDKFGRTTERPVALNPISLAAGAR